MREERSARVSVDPLRLAFFLWARSFPSSWPSFLLPAGSPSYVHGKQTANQDSNRMYRERKCIHILCGWIEPCEREALTLRSASSCRACGPGALWRLEALCRCGEPALPESDNK